MRSLTSSSSPAEPRSRFTQLGDWNWVGQTRIFPQFRSCTLLGNSQTYSPGGKTCKCIGSHIFCHFVKIIIVIIVIMIIATSCYPDRDIQSWSASDLPHGSLEALAGSRTSANVSVWFESWKSSTSLQTDSHTPVNVFNIMNSLIRIIILKIIIIIIKRSTLPRWNFVWVNYSRFVLLFVRYRHYISLMKPTSPPSPLELLSSLDLSFTSFSNL